MIHEEFQRREAGKGGGGKQSVRSWDCIVCGSCTVDIVARPISLDEPIGRDRLHRTDPIVGVTGGLVSNSGIALARLGARVAAFSRVGDDVWGEMIRRSYQQEGIDTTCLESSSVEPSSVTIVAVDAEGRRSFVHSQGAPKSMDATYYRQRMAMFAQARCMLLGYYSLLPQLEDELPELLAAIRSQGCWTAMDAAGDGGTMTPLRDILPQLDYYIPSLAEAESQTGETDPQRIIECYRDAGARGVVGVKLGERGAILSEGSDLLAIPAETPPAPVVDTTGAGDAFFAGLLMGQLRGKSLEESGQLGAKLGAWCVTAMGASSGLPKNLPF